MGEAALTDGFGRAFHYLRLSVDEACNYRCVYCLPDGYKKSTDEPALTAPEIGRLARAFAEMGFWKIRLTGGEPTTRPDVVELAEICASTPGVRRVALSTNGYRLAALAEPLARAGVKAVNVSVDSLDPANFARITGKNDLSKVLAGVEACLTEGLETKINVVMLRGFNAGDLAGFLRFSAERRVEVRFIELMQTTGNEKFFKENHMSGEAVLDLLKQDGWSEQPRREGDGPAIRFRRHGAAGAVGLIAPYRRDFCSSCNRLRVTSRGALRLCLFSDGSASLRDLLQRDADRPALQARVRALLTKKEVSHYLPEGRFGDTKHLAMMGG
jgi:cyclic pyranopterin phosphate synthase